MVNPQLVITRQFFDDARRAPAAATPFVRMKRSMHLDLCVEMVLNVIINERGNAQEQQEHGARKPPSWHDLWRIADGIARREGHGSLPERARLKDLHDRRNLAQHRGSVPSAEDIQGLVEPVRALLEFVCQKFFKADFEGLQEWDALECAPLRNWINDCAKVLDDGHVAFAMGGCKFGYERMIAAVRDETSGDILRHFDHHIRVPMEHLELAGPLHDALEQLADGIRQVFLMLGSEVVTVALGLSFVDHFRFVQVGRAVVVTESYGGPLYLNTRGDLRKNPEAKRDASFMVNHVGKMAVMLESAYPGVFDRLDLPDKRMSDCSLWNLDA